jgi:hypothetical protein
VFFDTPVMRTVERIEHPSTSALGLGGVAMHCQSPKDDAWDVPVRRDRGVARRPTLGKGWTREDYKGFATVLSPDGLIAIAVASGDDGTGDIHADVTTRSPKGIATIEAVSGNLSLPLDDRYVADNERIAIRVDAAATDNSTTTYFLLHDRRGGIRYAELSRPMSINKKGYAETWEPRIPITAKPLDPVVVKVDGDPPINPIVPVKRRDSI